MYVHYAFMTVQIGVTASKQHIALCSTIKRLLL